jgi:hypothetical protein
VCGFVLEGEAASSADQGRQLAGAVAVAVAGARQGRQQFHSYRRAGLSPSVSSACA